MSERIRNQRLSFYVKEAMESILEGVNRDESQEELISEDARMLGMVIDILREIGKLSDLPPYLITWNNQNMVEPIRDMIDKYMWYIDYERVGNMDTDFRKFECNDDYHDILYKYRDRDCDYTNHLKIDHDTIMGRE